MFVGLEQELSRWKMAVHLSAIPASCQPYRFPVHYRFRFRNRRSGILDNL